MNTRILLSFLLLVSIENFAATIILLNGNSSAGKTTIAQELQKLSENPLLRTGIDHFLDMILRERYDESGSKAHEGWKFDVLTDADNKPIVHITQGPLAKKMGRTIAQFIKCLADEGHDVVVDEVLLDEDDSLLVSSYVAALREHTVYFVGVLCDLEELERREVQRGDRMIGLVRGLSEIVHRHKEYYDIVVDTTHLSGAVCAQKIWDAMNAMPNPQGLKRFDSDNRK